jgi:dolichyl-phosphate-mannose--protein O-mannosyl transferase
MVRVWPWKLPPLLATIYAGPFFAYGVSALMLAREAEAEARRIVLTSMLAFTVLVVLASLLHLKLFDFGAPAAWVWFAALVVAGAVLAFRLASARALR